MTKYRPTTLSCALCICNISSKHQQRDDIQAALLNAKGFGGNNATALVLTPSKTKQMLKKRHGEQMLADWQQANTQVQQQYLGADRAYLPVW
ncbi:hypothetical protein [Pelagibaculum spongiae]|uniref:Uncharacterized protein n=1 Tax=Pelagibaculum spongiae TaxID=2080658 RepID=A0A2V1H5W4_9GAMM|nr:hypothetical protein [Pelagibaculum spongiae]PVZ72145.1 hypothetical protein DC094_03785 [Pelagibaculum spongiae]